MSPLLFNARLGSVVLAAALAVAPAARACGYHDASLLNLGMLNLAYPNALFVRTAVWMAQRDGVIPANAAPAASDSLVAGQRDIYGLLGTVAALGQLRDRLEASLDGRALPAFSVVLMRPMLWSRFEPIGSAIKLQPHTTGPVASDVVIVTDEPVVEALLDGRLSPEQAQARGLIRFYGGAAEVASLSSLLNALSADRTASAVVPGQDTTRSP